MLVLADIIKVFIL